MSEPIPHYTTIVLYAPEGEDVPAYLAVHPEIEDWFAQGETPEAAIANLAEVTELILEHLRENGLPIPEPSVILSDAPQRLYWVGERATLTEFVPVVA
jgi:predicted RNase H-like HicB family nuclease